jgi:VanZ family protein
VRIFIFLIVLIAFFLMALSTMLQLVAVTEQPSFHSLYKEGFLSLFPLDAESSFYSPYSIEKEPSLLMRKLGHFVLYGILAAVLFAVAPVKQLWLRGLVASGSSSIIGLMDELHQHVLLNRAGRLLDVYINAAGSICFALIMIFLYFAFLRSKRA